MTGNAGSTSRLRIIYRSHGGENVKSRPAYYNKLLCLASVVRAVEASGASPQVIFLNDGQIPANRLALMRSAGDVIQIDAGSNRRSYRAAIDLATRSRWDPADLVWFAEDDYLYRPESFRILLAGWNAIESPEYMSIYGGLALDLTSPRSEPRALPQLGAVAVPDPVEVEGGRWFRGVSTTSTFGVRLSVLREDRRLLRALPFSGGSWDHTTCLAVQGLQPFTWSEVGGELLPFGSQPAKQWPVSIVRGTIRAGVNLRSRRAAEHRRTLYLCDPVGAVHLELPGRVGDYDWEALAGQVRVWALGRGIPVSSGQSSVPG